MSQPFIQRLYIYQKERFPLLIHLPLITAFCFSVIGYSRACRMEDGFIPLCQFVSCVGTNFVLFFILRVADEHKDNEDDKLFRKYLPVPRGLITLKELRIITLPLFIIVSVVNVIWFSQLLPLYVLMMGYLLLMRYEFFIAEWLKKRQVAYIVSHMFIIPLADIYASGYDWLLADDIAPVGLFYFFCVSFLSGIVMEIGRKMRVQETEEQGVVSYTKLWGVKKATLIWLLLLILNFSLVHIAIWEAGGNKSSTLILNVVFIIALLPALAFLRKQSKVATKAIESMSLLWALGMYLILGSTHYL